MEEKEKLDLESNLKFVGCTAEDFKELEDNTELFHGLNALKAKFQQDVAAHSQRHGVHIGVDMFFALNKKTEG